MSIITDKFVGYYIVSRQETNFWQQIPTAYVLHFVYGNHNIQNDLFNHKSEFCLW